MINFLLLDTHILFSIILVYHVTSPHQHSDKPLLLLISFDGFRFDYIDRYNMSTFANLRKNATTAHHMQNVFPSMTFPNHWTIVTGLNTETHGVIDNFMFDPVLNKTFNYKMLEQHTFEWYGQNEQAEPIWTRNQRAGDGRRSAAEWPGSGVIFKEQNVLNILVNRTSNYFKLVDEFIALFTDEKSPINVGAAYFEEPG